jgi:DNA-binding PadR family transcriptional regulator
MSYVEILILRHLSKRPAHGYELRKRVEAVTGVMLHNNSLYPALRRFEEAGAVVKTSQAQEGRPPKLVYELTDVGHNLLHDMLADLPADQAGDDTEFLARLGQFELLSAEEQLRVLRARDDALAERCHRLHELSGRARGDRWSTLVTAELIARAERERAWIAELGSVAEPHSTAQLRGPVAEAPGTYPPFAPPALAAPEAPQECPGPAGGVAAGPDPGAPLSSAEAPTDAADGDVRS